jgi:hypothetical protein
MEVNRGGIKKYSRSSALPPITLVNAARGQNECSVASFKVGQWEDRMRTLHVMVPVFFTIQFVVVLLAMAAAMAFADPRAGIPTRRTFRRNQPRRKTASPA